jgi:hypothetical protein
MLALKSSSPIPALPAGLQHFAKAEDHGACRCGASLPLQVRLGLRSRSRPVLDGRWTCNPRCLRRQVAAMVQRELQPTPMRRPYRHRVPLGLLLLSSGAITHEELKQALARQHRTGERIGDVLQRGFGLSERSVAEALALQWGCGLTTEISLEEDRAACIAPLQLMENTGMLPVRMTREGRIHVAFGDSLDALAIFALQRIHHISIHAGIAPISTWMDGRARLADAQAVDCEQIECADAAAMERLIVQTLCEVQPVESRFVRVHDMHWLRLWLEPLALAGGPSQREDVRDLVFRIAPPRPPLHSLSLL